MGCIFCDLVEGKIPCDKVYETNQVLAFKDISPKAPTHILIIPKKHIRNILEFEANDDKLIIELQLAIKQIAEDLNLKKSGFRIVTNTGIDSGQEVDHLHFHMLGGRKMSWPPG